MFAVRHCLEIIFGSTALKSFLLAAAGCFCLNVAHIPSAVSQTFDEIPEIENLQTPVRSLQPDGVIRIGLLDFEGKTSYFTTRDAVQADVVSYLQRRFPKHKIQAKYYTSAELANAVKRSEVEFFLASSGFYVSMLPYGVRDVGTLVSSNFPDPNHVVAGTMFVRSDQSTLSSLRSVRHLRAVSTHPMNFMTYQINLGEIALNGYDPDKFFSSIEFTNNDPRAVVDRVLSEQADVGLLRHCMLEAITAEHPEIAGKLKVINQKASSPSPCMASTQLYPGWTMAVTPHTPPQIARDLAKLLLDMRPEDSLSGYTWSLATDFKRVNNVLKLLRVGPYSYLKEQTFTDFIVKIWPYIGFFVGLWVAGIIHLLRVKKLVIRRTQQLSDTMERERQANARAQEIAARLDLMQRISTISQLSSIFAHELGQPLSAMRYSVRGLQTLFSRLSPEAQSPAQAKSMSSCIEILQKQLARCAEIIDRVRNYAKQNGGREQAVNLRSVIDETVKDIQGARTAPACLELSLPPYPLIVEGNAVELKLIVLNLIKNASEEIANTQNAPVLKIELTHDQTLNQAVLTVENSGRQLTEEDVRQLKEPFKTSKSKGLGLGIMIITSIAEAHRAQIDFIPRENGGLIVRFAIAIREDTEPSRITEAEDTEFGDKF